jgi:hypothetical protein
VFRVLALFKSIQCNRTVFTCVSFLNNDEIACMLGME